MAVSATIPNRLQTIHCKCCLPVSCNSQGHLWGEAALCWLEADYQSTGKERLVVSTWYGRAANTASGTQPAEGRIEEAAKAKCNEWRCEYERWSKWRCCRSTPTIEQSWIDWLMTTDDGKQRWSNKSTQSINWPVRWMRTNKRIQINSVECTAIGCQ